MRICPKCGTAYPARGRSTCTKDGARLVDAEEHTRAQHDPLLGQVVAGRFRVLERIGTGGMGTVYRAEQAGLGRQIALKVLKKELVSDRDTVARFQREAKAMSMLVHPNTVRVFDFGEDDAGHLYLAMELLEGQLLTAWIEREDAPPVIEAVYFVREILRSLAEAHSKSLIHRDLKPDNIFLARVEGESRPVVKVLDFGIAKVFRQERKIDELETQAGTVFGTPRYMSPEQAQGKPLDHRSDLYSVGVLLYHLLTGRPPFVDDDAVVVMAKHIRERPDSPRTAAPDRPIPRSLEKIVEQAMAKDPSGRFENADAFEAALTACIAEVHAEERERRKAGAPAVPRVPLLIGGGLVALGLVSAVAIVLASSPDDVAEAHEDDAVPALGVEPAPPRAEPAVVTTLTPVTLASEPQGAAILRGDQQIGTTPQVIELAPGQSMQLTLRAAGHAPAEVEITPEAAPVHQVTLIPDRQPRTPRARPPREPSGQAEPTGDPYERFE